MKVNLRITIVISVLAILLSGSLGFSSASTNSTTQNSNSLEEFNIANPLANDLEVSMTSLNVLLLPSDIVGTTASELTTSLVGFGHTVDTIDVATSTLPILAVTQGYDVVIIWSGDPALDNAGWGNLLADYVDSGGTVIMSPYTYYTTAYTPTGRWTTDGYSPYAISGNDNINLNYDGLSLHETYVGISTYAGSAMYTALTVGATSIASYTDGTSMAATKGRVLGFNSAYYVATTYRAGDFFNLMNNFVKYMGLPPLTANVLLLPSDSVGTTASELTTSLVGFGHTVDTIDVATSALPTLAVTQGYDVVIIWSGDPALDNAGWGNLLADYVDSGGTVIMSPYTYYTTAYTPTGRWATDGYSPYAISGNDNVNLNYDGLSVHKTYVGISTYAGSAMYTALTVGATSIASYTDGTSMAATKGRVLGFNSAYYVATTYRAGDFFNLMNNFVKYMGLPPLTANVLLLPSDSVGTTASELTTSLVGFGHTVDTIDVATSALPTLAVTQGYDVVIIWSGDPALDNAGWGNLLADYVDSGGTVIMSPYTYYTTAYTPTGRWATDGYSPYAISGNDNINLNYDGLSLHETYVGISAFASSAMYAALTVGATSIASYTDGTPMAATKGRVLGFNSAYYVATTYRAGDFFNLMNNFVKYMGGTTPPPNDPPSIDTPIDITYAEGSIGNIISWTPTDTDTGTYTIAKDGVDITSGSWTSGVAITLNIDGLAIGTYTYVITLQDTGGNSVSDTVLVIVSDLSSPTLSSPDDFTYSEGSTGNSIIWTASDDRPATYSISRDGVEVASGAWSSGVGISLNIDGLTIGTYTFIIIVLDTSDNSASDSVLVTVSDTSSPIVTSPSDLSYSEGETGNSITWIATDPDPATYSITRGGIEIANGPWSSGVAISVNVDGLTVGTYTFVITVLDTPGNSATDTVLVTVSDTSSPILTSPSDFSYSEGSIGMTISWTATDSDPDTYSITRDGVEVTSGFWSSGVAITVIVDGLTIGTYTFTISVFDAAGNSASDTVLVTVSDATSPILTSPDDLSYSEGSVSNTISWTATDTDPTTYSITRNGVEVASGLWSSGVSISINIDGLTVGTYTFIITVFDTAGNSATDTVIITVSDDTNPSLSSPADISYSEGSSGNTILWTATDANPGSYSITKDGVEVASGSWSSGVVITHSVNGLTVGTYLYEIIVNDSEGNFVSDLVNVVVITPTETSDPETSTVITSTRDDPSATPDLPVPAGSVYLWLGSIFSIGMIVRKRRNLKI